MEDSKKTKKQLIEELNCLRLEKIEQTRTVSDTFTKAFLQNSIPIIITTLKEGRVVEANDAFIRAAGLKRHEVIGRTIIECGFITKEKRADYLNELKNSGRVENFEMEIRPQSGALRYGLFNTVMVSIGNENCLLTTIQDITESKQWEKALVDSEEKFRMITENMLDCVALMDTNGVYQYTTPSYLETLGYSSEEMLGFTGFSITHPDDIERVFNILVEGSKLGLHEIGYEIRIRHKDGHYVPIETKMRSLKDPQGKIIGVVLSARDITLRKQAEGALRESEEKYRRIAVNMDDVVTESDVKGRITYVSPSYVKLTGRHPNEIIGTFSYEYVHPEDLDRVKAKSMEALRTKEDVEIEYRHRHADGHYIWVRSAGHAMYSDAGEFSSIIVTSHNITARKQAEGELLKTNAILSGYMRHSPIYTFIKEVYATKSIVLQASENYRDMIGIAGSEMAGKTNEELFPPEMAANITADDLAVVADGNVLKLDEEHNGRIYSTIKFPLLIGDKTLLAGYTIDITNSRLMEKELQKSEKKYRLLFNSGRDYVAVHLMGKDGQLMNFIEVNDTACEIFGYTREEFLRLTPQDVDSGMNSEQMLANIEKLVENNHVLFESEMISKCGHTIPMEVSLSLFQLNDNSAVMCVGRDITDRKNAEAILTKSAEKYRLIAENITDSIFLLDEKGIFQYATNHKNTLGYELEELIGITAISITHPDDIERIKRIHQDAVEQVWQEIAYETNIRHKDGHYVLMALKGSIFTNPSGNTSGAVFTGREIIAKTKQLSAKDSLSDGSDLSSREKEILKWVMEGKSTWDISKILDIGEATIKYHIDKIMKKLSATNRTHAVTIAMRNDLLD